MYVPINLCTETRKILESLLKKSANTTIRVKICKTGKLEQDQARTGPVRPDFIHNKSGSV
jgi:hypothetical protein